MLHLCQVGKPQRPIFGHGHQRGQQAVAEAAVGRPQATGELANDECGAPGGVREKSVDGATPFRARPASPGLDVAHRCGHPLRGILILLRLSLLFFLDLDGLASGREGRNHAGECSGS